MSRGETIAQRNLRQYLETTLRAIAEMEVNEYTDHEQLSALCIGLSRVAVDRLKYEAAIEEYDQAQGGEA